MTDGAPILIIGVILVVIVIAVAIGKRGHKRGRKPPYADYPTWSGLGDNHDSGFSSDWLDNGGDSGGGDSGSGD